jgi:hypothetical protein
MSVVPTSPAAEQARQGHCPVCDDCGWLPCPYSGVPGDFVPCPCCQCSEARWTTEDCLPVALFDAPETEGKAS